MLDFVEIRHTLTKSGLIVEPFIRPGEESKDLMIKGRNFYAIWDEDKSIWSTKRSTVRMLVDKEIRNYIKNLGHEENEHGMVIKWASVENYGFMQMFERYCKTTADNSFVPLDSRIIFKSEPYIRENYSTFRLPYDPIEMEIPAYDKLSQTLYDKEDLEKIEWIVGAALSGENADIQKFLVLYGKPGSGKSTMIDIIIQLFTADKKNEDKTNRRLSYTASFDAAALGQSSNQFSLEPFKNNPVVAYQHDGDLSHIETNTKLNSIISHEVIPINEKNKSIYEMRITSVLIVGSNSEVKITDTKSGLLRRLICARPSERTLPIKEYNACKSAIKFELGGIAYKCMKFYQENRFKYDGHIDKAMLASTNTFFDYVATYYDEFIRDEESDGYVSLKVAWDRYKHYAEETNLKWTFRMQEFKNELSNYFEEYHREYYAVIDGERKHFHNVFRGFKKSFVYSEEDASEGILPTVTAKNPDNDSGETDIFEGLPDWLRLTDVSGDVDALEHNPFNEMFYEAKAQKAYIPPGGSTKDTQPKKSWDKWEGKLKTINTASEHFVLPQEIEPQLIFLDFDATDPETGRKDLRRNLQLASKFPKTYAETSRSGGGLHLYYIYDGDVNDLSNMYDIHIEIKKLTGKSTLRRKLYLCNKEEIAHISSGLPLEEVKKKMLDNNVIENEKHLRSLIKKGLAKKVHPDTTSSIHYIQYVLEQAYESGMKYDVNDMRPTIMNFAALATNQSEHCMAVACEMHYNSDEPSVNEETNGYLEKPIAFFDCEVFPNLFIVCYKVEGGTVGDGGKKEVVKLINPSANTISELVNGYRLIGFNNLNYDNLIFYGRMLGYTNRQLYELSQGIVNGEKFASLREAKNVSYTDIYDFSNTKQSLKKWEIELDINHQEFPLKWDEDVPFDMWELAADYCANDVVATEVTFYHLKEDWNARQVLAKLSGLTVNDLTNTHSSRIIFGTNRNPQSSFNYPDLSKEFPGYEFNPYGIDPSRYNTGKDGKSVKTSGKSIFMGDDPSEGGYVYFETGIHNNVALLDVASLHPSTIENLQLFGPEYTKRYSELKALRVAIKHREWENARGYLGGALVPFLEGIENLSEDEQQNIADSLSYAFKIVLNSAYGMTSASFPNPFKDPRNVDNVVAKRGALFMISLKYEVQKRGFTVVHVKTDSIKIADATPEIIEFVMEYGKKYGYTFEHEATYKKICLVNKSVYIAKYDEYGERGKKGRHANCWTATGAEFQHPYIFKTLFTHESVEFKDLCETKSVSGKGAIYLDYNEELIKDKLDELYSLKERLESATSGKMDIRRAIKAKQEEIDSIHNLAFVGRCGLFTPVEDGVGGGYLMRVDDERTSFVAGTKGYRWIESIDIKKKHLEERINKAYFRALIDSAVNHIAEYGNSDEFING